MINSTVEIEPLAKDFNQAAAEDLVRDTDLVLDGTDNMQTRFLINDFCVKHHIPWIYTGAIATYGMTMPIVPEKTPCFRCFLPSPPAPGSLPTCDTAGVLNTITTIIASIESTEALKLLLGKKEAIQNGQSVLTMYDAWYNKFDTVAVFRDDDCPCCVNHHFDFLNAEKKEIIETLCGRNAAIQITPADSQKIDLNALAEKLQPLGMVKHNKFFLLFRTEKEELTIFSDGRTIIRGALDEKLARTIYARYIGI